MKKIKNNAGFTLIELICTLLILVLLVMAIGVGMDTGSKIYRDATFEADSASLAGILNTSLSDILRFCYVLDTENMEGVDYNERPFVITSLDYGVQLAYFEVETQGATKGVLRLKNLQGDTPVQLVNTGAYPDLQIGADSFYIHYEPRRSTGVQGGYFEVSYDIVSKNDPTKIREVTMIVRQMND